MTNVEIAVVCHEANRSLCEISGDYSQKSWNNSEQWQRDSAIAGVDFALVGSSGPEAQHEAWSRDKLASGWVYGAEKNSVLKTHPCLVPYNNLPRFQQAKDKLFQAIVLALKD